MIQYEKNKNWERLEAVIRWSGMSINFFARHIGLPRGENLYQIRKGNNGISKDVARRVIEAFPEISELWLLTGSGQMFTSPDLSGVQIPLYRVDAEQQITRHKELTPDEVLVIPLIDRCDVAMYYLGDAMRPRIPSGSVLFLRRVMPEEIIPGRDYITVGEGGANLRTVRTAESNEHWKLDPCDHDRFDAWNIPRSSVREAWLVCAHLVQNK